MAAGNVLPSIDARRRIPVAAVTAHPLASAEFRRYRVDLMPCSGIKASGPDTEGVRYSIEQMIRERVIITRLAA